MTFKQDFLDAALRHKIAMGLTGNQLLPTSSELRAQLKLDEQYYQTQMDIIIAQYNVTKRLEIRNDNI